MAETVVTRLRESISPTTESGEYRASPVKTVLTPREAARELLISMPTMYELCHRADFPAFRIGKKILINRQALAEWIERESGRGTV